MGSVRYWCCVYYHIYEPKRQGYFREKGCVNFEFVEEIEPAEKHGPGKWRFLECNPRFSGGLAFSAVAGYDMVRNHINCFKGIGLEPEGEIRNQYVARRYTEVVTG